MICPTSSTQLKIPCFHNWRYFDFESSTNFDPVVDSNLVLLKFINPNTKHTDTSLHVISENYPSSFYDRVMFSLGYFVRNKAIQAISSAVKTQYLLREKCLNLTHCTHSRVMIFHQACYRCSLIDSRCKTSMISFESNHHFMIKIGIPAGSSRRWLK